MKKNTEKKFIWVTGKSGQLSQCLKDVLNSKDEYITIYTSQSDLNLLDLNQVETWIADNNIDFIINTAAYTAVDAAETNVELAMEANGILPGVLAEAANNQNAQLIHISTDYVFRGDANKPYTEIDTVNPQSVYGQTKLRGEGAIKKVNKQAITIRTSWLYSEYGHNFVKTMLKLGKERTELKVVNDQQGSPTYAAHLASAIIEIIDKISSNPNRNYGGIYHFTNAESCTWYNLATKTMQFAQLDCKVLPCTSAEFPTAAKRPAYSVMNCEKIKATFSLSIENWQNALKECIEKLQNS